MKHKLFDDIFDKNYLLNSYKGYKLITNYDNASISTLVIKTSSLPIYKNKHCITACGDNQGNVTLLSLEELASSNNIDNIKDAVALLKISAMS